MFEESDIVLICCPRDGRDSNVKEACMFVVKGCAEGVGLHAREEGNFFE